MYIILILFRDRLFQTYRTTFPDRIFARRHQLQRRRGEYIVPGPNYIWSVDGYMKLEPYGIEIYAGIDAYSRYIIWIYCGITARTALSVLNQFLDIVETVQLQPQKIRSDHGSERGRFQNIYLQLQQAYDPSIQLADCWIEGRSTENQRIEAWWEQLSKSALYKWRVSYYISCTGSISNNIDILPYTER